MELTQTCRMCLGGMWRPLAFLALHPVGVSGLAFGVSAAAFVVEWAGAVGPRRLAKVGRPPPLFLPSLKTRRRAL